MIVIGGKGYELVMDHKDGWNPEAFRGRYSEVLDRYDYIVGDWGYNQLRLKGFYRDNHPKVNRDTAFSSVTDYINEYCNFGCAYFVLGKLKESPKEGTYKDILTKDPVAAKEPDIEEEADTETAGATKAPERTPPRAAHNYARTSSVPSAKEQSSSREGSVRDGATPKDKPQREHRERPYPSKRNGRDGKHKPHHHNNQGSNQQASAQASQGRQQPGGPQGGGKRGKEGGRDFKDTTRDARDAKDRDNKDNKDKQ